MKIPTEILDQLRLRGLLVGEPMPSNSFSYPDGVIIAKPASAGGNGIVGYDDGWRGVAVDAPSVTLHRDGEKWIVTSWDYIPGPGPGDFVNEWPSAAQAIADIVDFFFGDPARMIAKRSRRSSTPPR